MPPSRPSNVKLLTEGAQYIKRKRRQDNGGGGREKQIDKILFNDDDRAEFLTGFSKRKQAKLAEKRERAKKRDEDELKAQKKEMRIERKAQAAAHVAEIEKALGIDPAFGENAMAGPSSYTMAPPVEEEFSDEEGDQHATVTIVEEDFTLDPHGPPPPAPAAPTLGGRSAKPLLPQGEAKPQRSKVRTDNPLAPTPKLKNKSGKKTMLRGSKALAEKKREARKHGGGFERDSGPPSRSKKGGKGVWRGQ